MVLLASLAQPVGSLTRAGHVLGDESLVAAVAAGLHPAELCRGNVGHGAVLKGDGQLGVDGAGTGAALGDLVHLLDDDDLRTVLSSGTGGAAAGQAGTDDEDLGLGRVDDLVVGNRLGSGHERGLLGGEAENGGRVNGGVSSHDASGGLLLNLGMGSTGDAGGCNACDCGGSDCIAAGHLKCH